MYWATAVICRTEQDLLTKPATSTQLCQRYSNKTWAEGYEQTLLRNHGDWPLGEEVAELKTPTPSGEESISPAWPVVLRYKLEVRKGARRQLSMNGTTLAAAFAAGRRGGELRKRYLVTPLSLGGTQGGQQETRPADVRQPRPKPQPQPKQRRGFRQDSSDEKQRGGNEGLVERARSVPGQKRNNPGAIQPTNDGHSICLA